MRGEQEQGAESLVRARTRDASELIDREGGGVAPVDCRRVGEASDVPCDEVVSEVFSEQRGSRLDIA